MKPIKPKPIDYAKWLESMRKDPFSDKFVQAVEEQIRQRRAPWNMRGGSPATRRQRKGRVD